MAKVLVISSLVDFATEQAERATYTFVEWARKQGHDVTYLTFLTSTRVPLWLTLWSGRYDLTWYAGHGDVDMWVGNELLWGLIKAEDNSDWLKGQVCVGIPVCLSGQRLAPDLYKNGALAVFASTDYMFAAFPEPGYDYSKDFRETWMLLPQLVLQNYRFGDALKTYREKCYGLAKKYEEQKPEPSWDWYCSAIKKNADFYTLVGNPDEKLSDVRGLKGSFSDDVGRRIREAALGFIAPVVALYAASVAAPIVMEELKKREIIK